MLKREPPRQYVYNNVHDLVRVMITFYPQASPIKIHKLLYFTYVFYRLDRDRMKRRYFKSTPKELFPAEFEAWQSGPVVREVWLAMKNDPDFYKESLFEDSSFLEIKHYKKIQDLLFAYLDAGFDISDFGLCDRSKQSITFKTALKSVSKIIDNDMIFEEFKLKEKTRERDEIS